MTQSLLLLFGMPRSGTTWIAKIVDSHPNVLYRHEPDSRLKLNKLSLFEDISEVVSCKDYIEQYVQRLVHINLPQVTSKRPLFAKAYSSSFRFNAYRASVIVSGLLSRFNRHLVLPTLNPVTKPDAGFVLAWKSIESLGRLGLLARCLPDSRCVHILRHPCGYIASVLGGERSDAFVSTTASSEDYDLFSLLLATPVAQAYGLSLEELKAMTPLERLTWRWLLINEKALQDLQGLENSCLLRYEDMCQDPLGKSRELLRFAGLDWHQQTESFVRGSTTKSQSGYYSVFKNPLESANKWRQSLTSAEQDAVWHIVRRSDALSQLYSDDDNEKPNAHFAHP